MEGYKLVIDCSYWQQALGFGEFKEYVKGVVFRSTYGTWKDKKFKEHVKGAIDFGYKHVATYSWFRPMQSVKAQIETVKMQIDNTPVDFVLADIEESSRISYDNFPRYSPEQLNDFAWQFVSGLETLGVKVGIYTRSTWVDKYCPKLVEWMYRYPVWLASYPFAKGRLAMSWRYLLDHYAPKVFSPYYVKSWGFAKDRTDMWQWSGDKFVLPGIYREEARLSLLPVDLNYASDEFFDLMQIRDEVILEPEPYETYRNLATWGMKIRVAPSANAVDTNLRIPYFSTFKVYEKVVADGYTWGRISMGQWVALKWSIKV